MVHILHLAVNTFPQAIISVFHFVTGYYFQQTIDPSLTSTSQTRKNIVILGGSYAGITAAHGILKHTAKAGLFKITLVSPSTHHYGNMAAARGILPDQFTDDQLFVPIAPGFAQYPKSQFEFILASAESLDVKAKKVRISSATGHSTLDYDFLILATGSRTTVPTPLKGLESTEVTKAALNDFQARVSKAKKIVVAGAGITGVEVAGELAYYGHSKEIILVSIHTSAVKGCGISFPLVVRSNMLILCEYSSQLALKSSLKVQNS
jgi:NAD(P)H-nitrite reductase large subunit